MKSSESKFVLVIRKTRLQDLIRKYNTKEQAKFYIEHMGIDFDDYLIEDQNYQKSIEMCYKVLEEAGKVQLLDREYLPNYLFGKEDIIIVVGQDGLVANTLKYLNEQMVIAINPDPKRWDGILLPFKVDELKLIIKEVQSRKRNIKEITMAKAKLNDGQVMYGVNDLFIGQKSHVSSRYYIKKGSNGENQSSSGIIISTGLGSTGWLKSILSGSARIMAQCINNNKLYEVLNSNIMKWDDNFLYYSVREPFKSKTTGDSIVFGKIEYNSALIIQSHMPENGRIFSDGIEEDFLEFNSGMEVRIEVADKKGMLVV